MFARNQMLWLKPPERRSPTAPGTQPTRGPESTNSMWRRAALAATAMSMAIASLACNSITETDASNQALDGRKGTQGVPTLDKFCIDDLRAVVITSPGKGGVVHNGDEVAVTWDVEQFCAEYTARVRVSIDGGATWQAAFEGRNATSMQWSVPQRRDVQLVLEVTIEDVQGSVLHEQAVGFTYVEMRRLPRQVRERD